MNTKTCQNGPCRPTTHVPFRILERYKLLAMFQAISYCPSDSIESWNCGLCSDASLRNVTDLKSFSTISNVTSGFIGVLHDQKTILVSLQGVINRAGWKRCFRGRLVPLQTVFPNSKSTKENILVHYGYQKTWLEIFPIIYDFLNQNIKKYPSYTVSFIGHSFGGGVVGIIAANIASRSLGPLLHPSNVEIITLGSSRVGNHAFANLINNAGFKDVARLIHTTDIVPHLPFQYRYQRYEHYKGEIWLSALVNDKNWVFCDDRDSDNPSEAKNCANTVPWNMMSTKTHVSYWTRTVDVVCTPIMKQGFFDIVFLPKYALYKY